MSIRVCVVGAGLSGLSAAFYLSEHPGVTVEVFEQDDVVGGRANVTADGEHCPRLFLSDYDRLFEILRAIPAGSDDSAGSVHDGLRRLRRYYRTERGTWVEIAHLYAVFARDVTLRERLRGAIARRRSPLVAEAAAPNANRYGSRRNFSYRTIVRLGLNLLKSRTAYALVGPTDECLTGPWVRHLERRGVVFRTGTRVASIAADADGVTVAAGGGPHAFDAALVTAFAPDAIALLEASGYEHRLRQLDHIHCACFTVTLDAAEPILAGDGPAVYCREGINMFVQPAARRCIVLCTNSASTDERWVIARMRELLDLRYDVVDVRARENHALNEAVYCADYVDRDAILARAVPRLYFAGTYVGNSYPLDSGEGAARSAWDAVRLIRRDHDLALAPLPASLAAVEA